MAKWCLITQNQVALVEKAMNNDVSSLRLRAGAKATLSKRTFRWQEMLPISWG